MDLRKLRFLPLALVLHTVCAGENGPQWLADVQHPLLQYRFQCAKGAETVLSAAPCCETDRSRCRDYNCASPGAYFSEI
jgi:hypothetical protein